MTEPVRTAVIYYSATGSVHAMASRAAQTAEKAGSEVRLRRVQELAPPAAIAANKQWAEHAEATAGVETATPADMEWADLVLLGTPTRFGGAASQLKQFLSPTHQAHHDALSRHVYTEATCLPRIES